jgi:hypothetical protein
VPLAVFLVLALPLVLAFAGILGVFVVLRRRHALDPRGEVNDPVEQRLLERCRDPVRVDRADRLLPEAFCTVQGLAAITGVERRGDGVALLRERRGEWSGKLGLRGGVSFGAAPAAGEAQCGRESRTQITPCRSGLPPLQASGNPA